MVPPRRVGGNLDIRDLAAGTVLYLPVEVDGALFSVGDTHAAQGDGEVLTNLPDRPLRRISAGPFRKPHPQRVAKLLLERGVVGLRCGHIGFEQHPPSIDSQRPSRVCTLFATATWVCRSGSPARLSRWVNAAATRPRTLTCRIPCGPVRVNRACSSTNANASFTAARWARSITAATAGSATAHKVDTDFTGENVRS